jgi:hypothetical protein
MISGEKMETMEGMIQWPIRTSPNVNECMNKKFSMVKVETYTMDKRSEGRSYSVDHTGMVHNSGYNVNESLKGMRAGE